MRVLPRQMAMNTTVITYSIANNEPTHFPVLHPHYSTDSSQHHDQQITTLAKSLALYKAAMAFNMYFPPLLILAGFVGNSLALLVMLQRHNRRFSCCIYLSGLAVGDNLFMCNALHLWIMTAHFPEKFTNNHCKVVAYFFQVSIRCHYFRYVLFCPPPLTP